ncbi:MAG: inositol 2-dehydrogenase [Chloroflexi bacterium]|nr:inositol 2-dehydrogenase [Chloroflexota bacterium]
MTIKLGIIGVGRVGRLHASILTSRVANARLLAIADIFPEAAKSAAEAYGIPDYSSDAGELINSSELDAIVICSSTDTHVGYIVEAAEAGKHVFCEKPIDHDLAAIDKALRAVEANGVKLQVGFNRRFDSGNARVKQAIESGEIGQPQMLSITSRDPAPPPIDYIKVSGGLMMDMMIHDFDLCRFLLGDVAEMYAMADVMVDPAIGQAGDVDTAKVMLRFENGAIGTIENSRQAVFGYDQRLEVFGSGGEARTGNVHPNQVTISDASSVRRDLIMRFFVERYFESYVAEMNAFVDAIENDTDVPVNGADGRAPVLMAMAGLRSLRENRPVRLDEI